METILQFKNLDYYYESNGKKVAILDNVNFSFQKGHFYTILGPSGSGKTTTLSLGCGLDIPKNGYVLFNGKDIRKIGLDRYRNQNVSVIFQSYNLITYMTALQNVLTAMEITGVKVQNKTASVRIIRKSRTYRSRSETKCSATKWRATAACSNCSSVIL